MLCLALGACASASSPRGGPIDCTTREDASSPVLLAPDQLVARYGHGVARFSQLETSLEQPVEVCGDEGQARYLQELTCDDGRAPFSNAPAAKLARYGAAGMGGRCGSVIDHFRVRCTEGEYDVYMDMYMCPSH